MGLLLSNNKQVGNGVSKDGMGTWGNQQSVVQTGGKPHQRQGYKATPADRLLLHITAYVYILSGDQTLHV
jgi:hypothetical protein